MSPQFHCIYDDEFSTCARDAKFTSLWQRKAKIQQQSANKTSDLYLPTENASTIKNQQLDLQPARDPVPMFVDTWESVDEDLTSDDSAHTSELIDNQTEASTDSVNSDTATDVFADDVEHQVEDVQPEPYVTRSGRRVKPVTKLNLMAASLSAEKPAEQSWHYRSVIGCLSYLQTMIRPDITMAAQQCARFCNAPTKEHERICRYFHITHDRGLCIRPGPKRGLGSSIGLHHLRSHVVTKTIDIQHISIKEQLTDMLTKPLPSYQFRQLRNRLMHWTFPHREGV